MKTKDVIEIFLIAIGGILILYYITIADSIANKGVRFYQAPETTAVQKVTR